MKLNFGCDTNIQQCKLYIRVFTTHLYIIGASSLYLTLTFYIDNKSVHPQYKNVNG
jgi:hypothetical protein